MNTTPLISLLSVLMISGCGEKSSHPSAARREPEVKPSVQVVAPKLPAKPLDLKANNLGEDYKGDQCEEIVASIGGANLSKDQYETTKAYQNRLKDLPSRALYDEVRFGDKLALAGRDSIIFASFDADKGVVSGKISFDGFDKYSKKSSPVVFLNIRSSDKSNYLASNAFGASATVNKEDKYVCLVTLTNVSFEQSYIKEIGFSFKSTPEQARGREKRMKVLFIGELASPYSGRYSDYSAPTITYPSEKYVKGDSLYINLRQLWIYDQATGDVLYKKQWK